MKERDKEMTIISKYISSAILPLLQERVGVRLLGALLLLLTACTSSDDAIIEQPGTEDAIVLGVKEVVSPVTRAQIPGIMNFTQLTTTGFGVYGYEGATAYNKSSSAFNLFAPNTKVTFDPNGTAPTTILDHPGSWEYAGALKEWNKNMKYSFFAYAPYMSVGEGAAGTDAGINTISTGAGDPKITYTVAEDPAESVDLLWGVRTDTKKESGLPWIDVTKGATTSAVLFTFYHALCAVGLHAQVMVDQANDTNDLGDLSQLGTIGDANGCKVTLKSITITPAGLPDEVPAVAATLFTKSAQLNLNNTNLNNTTKHQPLWESPSGTIANLVLNSDATIDAKLLDPQSGDTPLTSGEIATFMANSSLPGITESANSQTVIKNDKLFMLIPQAAQDYTIAIEYFLTYKTETGYHREAKSGTATIKNLELAAGVKYYLNLVFGLTTFKLSVDATDWEGQNINTTVVIENGTSASQSLAR